MAPLPKSGRFDSPTFLAFVRRLDCALCGGGAPSEPHHTRPTGRGALRDDLAIPVCRSCHMRSDGQTVEGRKPIPAALQRAAAGETWLLFVERASRMEWEQFGRDRDRWFESRVFV